MNNINNTNSDEKSSILHDYFNEIIEHTHDGFFVINLTTHKTEMVNEAFCNMVGLSRDETIGLNPTEFRGANNPKLVKQWRRDWIKASKILDKKGHDDYLTQTTNSNGQLIDTLVHRIKINIGPGYLICIHKDLTEINKLKTELYTYQSHLEELIIERTAELEQANERLKEQISQRIKFTRALVHELKTPLTPMLAASDILRNTIKDESSKDIAETIYGGACALNERIDELLDVARGEIGMLKLNRRKCDIRDIVKDVSQYMSYVFLSKKQTYTIKIPEHLPSISIDTQRIRQVLINLLDNASKYTQKGGHIALRIIDNPDYVSIEIEDDGLGIPLNKQKDLFAPYNTLTTRRRSINGIGLGLSLSKMLIELHEGEIWGGNNAKGKGSLFGFSLPYKPVMQ